MLAPLINLSLALAAVLMQVAFFTRLPSPLSDVSIVVAVAAWLVLRDRQAEALGWLLLGGFVLDLVMPYGFGTELALAGIIFLVMRFLYGRLISNAGPASAFLLAAAGVLAASLGLAVIDGLRVLFGRDPYLLAWGPDLILKPLLATLATGLAAAGLAYASALTGRLLERAFLGARHKLKL